MNKGQFPIPGTQALQGHCLQQRREKSSAITSGRVWYPEEDDLIRPEGLGAKLRRGDQSQECLSCVTVLLVDEDRDGSQSQEQFVPRPERS